MLRIHLIGHFVSLRASIDALDIKLVSRTKNLVEYAVWTQGVNFAFSEGDMLYRDLAAYEGEKPALQVISAKKAQGTKNRSFECRGR